LVVDLPAQPGIVPPPRHLFVLVAHDCSSQATQAADSTRAPELPDEVEQPPAARQNPGLARETSKRVQFVGRRERPVVQNEAKVLEEPRQAKDGALSRDGDSWIMDPDQRTWQIAILTKIRDEE